MSLLTADLAKIEIGSLVIPNQSYTLTRTGNTAQMHNARDGIYRKKTLFDMTGSFDAFYDDADPPEVEFDAGDTVTAKFYVDATHCYQASVIIDTLEINPANVVGEGIRVRGSFSLQSGTVTDPIWSP